MDLLIHEILHGLLALPLSYFIWKKTKSKSIALTPLVVAYAMDLDHLIEYWYAFGFGFNPYDFFAVDYFKISGRAFLILHAWEYVAILVAISWHKRWKSYALAIALGMLIHLIWDAVNVGRVSFYSITYRALQGFLFYKI